MAPFTCCSQAKAAVDNTQGSSFDPLLSLQTATRNNASPVIPRASNPSAWNKHTYSSYEASNSHTTPATSQTTTKTQPTAKRPRKRSPIADHQETGGLSKENRGGNSEIQHGDGIVATGRRVSFHPNRSDTHNSHRASTALYNEDNQFGTGNDESKVEEEGDWHDDIVASKDTACEPTRNSKAKAIERVSWQEDNASPGPGSQNTHGSGDTVDAGDDVSPDAGRSVAHTTIVMPKWPAETDMIFSAGRNRIGLMNQQSMVRFVLQDAIENVHVHLVLYHAFPNSGVALAVMRAALEAAAKGRLPGAVDILNRLLSDEEYFLNMSVIPRARIPIIRNGIKERCSALVAAEYMALNSLIKIAELVAKEQENYNYIYPVAMVGASRDVWFLKRSQPYRNKCIISVIHSIYFTGGVSSFARHFDHIFPRYRDSQGVVKIKVLGAMVALVVTVVYSTMFDWRSGEKEPMDFTTGGYIDPYDGNANTLKNMRVLHPNKYHTIMSDIYDKVSSISMGSTTALPIADIPFEELDG